MYGVVRPVAEAILPKTALSGKGGGPVTTDATRSTNTTDTAHTTNTTGPTHTADTTYSPGPAHATYAARDSIEVVAVVDIDISTVPAATQPQSPPHHAPISIPAPKAIAAPAA